MRVECVGRLMTRNLTSSFLFSYSGSLFSLPLAVLFKGGKAGKKEESACLLAFKHWAELIEMDGYKAGVVFLFSSLGLALVTTHRHNISFPCGGGGFV